MKETMKLIRHIEDIAAEDTGKVLVIGNFDGVHKGHLHLLDHAKNIAKKNNTEFGILTFEPHPRKLFRPHDPPFRITPYNVKNRRLQKSGANFVTTLDFDWEFASQGAEDFISNILDKALKPSHVVIGHDFRFGQLRKGDGNTIKDAGYEISVIEPYSLHNEERISSTQIRSALRHGHIDTANELLGWPWEIEGMVRRGDQRGRELGYPTANVHLEETMHPAYGIYASLVQITNDGEDAPWLPSATNIGIRPMFELQVGQVETFIFDFDRDIYDCTLRVRPVQRLRGEAKFESLDELIEQMAKDCAQAREILEAKNE